MIHRADLIAKGLRRLVRLPFPAAREQRFDFDALAREMAGGLSRREALRRLGLGLAAGMAADLTGLFGVGNLKSAAAQSDSFTATGTCNTAWAEACYQTVGEELIRDLWEKIGEKATEAVTDRVIRVLKRIPATPGSASALPAGSADELGGIIVAVGLEKYLETVLEAIKYFVPAYKIPIEVLDLGILFAIVTKTAIDCVEERASCPQGSRCSTNNVCCPDVGLGLKPLAGCSGFCCAIGLDCCAGQCTDTEGGKPVYSSATGYVETYTNCGGCGPAFTCRRGEVCVGGFCACGVGPLGGMRPCNADEYCDNGVCKKECGECTGGKVCEDGKCVCPKDTDDCDGSGICVPTFTKQNCGACGRRCTGGKGCYQEFDNYACLCPAGTTEDANGECIGDCPNGQVRCEDGTCVTLGTDDHCKHCGDRCTGGKVCEDGECRCPAGTDECNGICTLLSTRENCGACGRQCTGGKRCFISGDNYECFCPPGMEDVNGQCQCPLNRATCGDICCPEGQTCVNGTCTNCPAEETYDPATGTCSCGANPSCSGGLICVHGSCVSNPCGPGTKPCVQLFGGVDCIPQDWVCCFGGTAGPGGTCCGKFYSERLGSIYVTLCNPNGYCCVDDDREVVCCPR